MKNWIGEWFWNRQRKQAIKADQKNRLSVVREQPLKKYIIALSVTYKNVPMTKVNIKIAHMSTSAEQAKKEIKQFANLKISGIKEVRWE